MATQLKNDSLSTQFGAGGDKVAVNTWINLPSTMVDRRSVLITNQGVDNDLSTGTIVYMVATNSTTTTTLATTLPEVLVLGVGDSIERLWSSDVVINLKCATADQCVHIEELSDRVR